MFIKYLIIAALLSSTLNKVPCAFANSQPKASAETDIKTVDTLDKSAEDSTAPPSAVKTTGADSAATASSTPPGNTGEGSTVSTTAPDSTHANISDQQKPQTQSEDIKKPDSPTSLPDNPSSEIVKNPLQEKLKKELDEIDKHRAAIMTIQLKLNEIIMPFAQLRAACDKLRGVPIIESNAAWIALSRMYYYKSFSDGSCTDAINMCDWVFRAGQLYQAKAFGARATMLQELLFLADLYYRAGDRAKAEYCCKQFFVIRSEAQVDINNIKVLNNSSGPDPQKKAYIKALMPSANQILDEYKNETFHMGSINALIYLVQAHISYDKGDYVKSNEYLSKTKAEGMGFGKSIGQMRSANNSKTHRPSNPVNSKTKKK